MIEEMLVTSLDLIMTNQFDELVETTEAGA